MSDSVVDAKELVKQGHINQVRDKFLEPGQSALSTEQLDGLANLYEIALFFDANDPVSWLIDFDRSQPINIEVGNEKTRIGKVLALAEIYKRNKEAEIKKKNGPNQINREF